ncbi:hypothetical protein RB195_026168 [Necator americanus]|uniref:Uncharacterized protein n=1 Tax=Necator americanus TaxID=51031 RepID=A0ABR1EVP7_NECAM
MVRWSILIFGTNGWKFVKKKSYGFIDAAYIVSECGWKDDGHTKRNKNMKKKRTPPKTAHHIDGGPYPGEI